MEPRRRAAVRQTPEGEPAAAPRTPSGVRHAHVRSSVDRARSRRIGGRAAVRGRRSSGRRLRSSGPERPPAPSVPRSGAPTPGPVGTRPRASPTRRPVHRSTSRRRCTRTDSGSRRPGAQPRARRARPSSPAGPRRIRPARSPSAAARTTGRRGALSRPPGAARRRARSIDPALSSAGSAGPRPPTPAPSKGTTDRRVPAETCGQRGPSRTAQLAPGGEIQQCVLAQRATPGASARRSAASAAIAVHRSRVLQRGEVARVEPEPGRPRHAAHDLAAPRPGQVRDRVRPPSGRTGLPMSRDDRAAETSRPNVRVVARRPGGRTHEHDDHLALDLVRHADRRRLDARPGARRPPPRPRPARRACRRP